MPRDDIWSSICTTSQVVDLQRIIDILSDSLYKTGKQSWEETIASAVAASWAAYFNIPTPSRKAYLDGLKKRLSYLAVLRLCLATDLPPASIWRVCAWARANVAKDLVLDLEVDPSLIAGAQISWNGKYADLTKKAALEEILQQLKI